MYLQRKHKICKNPVNFQWIIIPKYQNIRKCTDERMIININNS